MKMLYLIIGLLILSAPAYSQDTVYVKKDSTTIMTDTTTARTEREVVVTESEPKETLFGTEAAIKNTVGLGPRVGFYKSFDATEGSFYFGLQTRIRLSPYFGIEGAVDYRGKEEFAFGADSTARFADVSYVPLTVSGIIFLPVSFNVVPYGVAGAGWYYTVVDYSNDPNRVDAVSSNKFGYHFGFGLEIPVSEHASLGADYRWIFLDTDFDVGTPSTLDPDNSNGSVISGSLMFYF